jgi:hypothetical protein
MASKYLPQAGGSMGVPAGSLFPQGRGAPLWARGMVLPHAEISLSDAAVTLGVDPPTARRARGRLGFGAFATLACGALLGLAVARGVGRPVSSAALPSATATPTQRPFVSVALRASAPGVRFRFEDGREVGNPYVGLMPRDERAQAVWAEAPGFLPRKLQLTFGDDVTIDDVLLVAGGAEPARSAAAPLRPRPEYGALTPPRPSSPKR